MLNNGAKWYNFSPPRWSFIAPPLTAATHEDSGNMTVLHSGCKLQRLPDGATGTV